MAPRPKGNPLPVDTDVHVPAAVRAAAAAADAHYTPPAAPSAPEADTLTIVEPPVAPPASAPAAAPEPTVTPAGNEPPTPLTAEQWEAKFSAENGRYRAARRDNAVLSGRITDLEALVIDLQTQLTSRASTPTPRTAPRLLTDEERENFGDEMLDVVGKRALETVTPEIQELKDTVAGLTARLQGREVQEAQTTREKMFEALATQVPDWEQVNFDPKFKAWLALPDPYSGATRQKLLTQAFEQNRTPQVLAFFKGFLAEEAALDPQPTTQVAPAATQPSKTPLEQFAAPGRAKTSAGTPPPVEKPIITTSQIKAFYDLVRANHYAGKDEEKDRLEAMIFAAQREGRVVSDKK